MLIKRLLPALLACSLPQEHIQRVVAFITGNDHFFLNLSMAACKAMMDAAANVPFSSMVTVMARNGVILVFGFPVLAIAGSGAPANAVEGLFFPDLALTTLLLTRVIAQLLKPQCGWLRDGVVSGDRQICGRHPADATNNSRRMQAITLGGNPHLHFQPSILPHRSRD